MPPGSHPPISSSLVYSSSFNVVSEGVLHQVFWYLLSPPALDSVSFIGKGVKQQQQQRRKPIASYIIIHSLRVAIVEALSGRGQACRGPRRTPALARCQELRSTVRAAISTNKSFKSESRAVIPRPRQRAPSETRLKSAGRSQTLSAPLECTLGRSSSLFVGKLRLATSPRGVLATSPRRPAGRPACREGQRKTYAAPPTSRPAST